MEAPATGSWFALIHMLGAVQGGFLAALLASRSPRSAANRVLAVVMLAFSVDLAVAVYHASGYHEVFPHLIGVDYPLGLLYGPLLYVYVRILSRRERSIKKIYLWHFLPFAVLLFLLIPFYVQSGTAKLEFADVTVSNPWSRALGIVNHLKLVHGLVYVAMILSLLRQHGRWVKDTFSYTERVNLVWLRNLVSGVLVLLGVVVVLHLLMQGDRSPVMGLDPETVYDDYTLLSVALFVYAIGFMGLRQPEVFDGRRHHARRSEPPAADRIAGVDRDGTATTTELPVQSERPSYARSGMDPETAGRYSRELVALMETEKLYRRGDLTLQDLADALSISSHNVTEVLNTQLGQNFYDFVNGYRVREVQERLADPEQAHLTLLAVAMDAGFNSKSSFNAVFKRHTGMTPSEFRAHAAPST